ncbi:CCR4-NOT transcription complex subunit 2 [Trypanosoma conorhini]|uniref:CCR4-NOT transcription complex subunit 2 n=1 Tax=Trypanosoma conorhini TaxID=83891 RepID=A0A422Q8T5_9TRYP|nr:CCR4-NOT transcription complex subunit 2 [Trypanosoma conorhini]RNF26349.1 CCR4-NOT transcription complex subunit 2 [Trypanosoma conorhini]
MNNSNQAARYGGALPPGVQMAYPAAAAPNPYQAMRGAYPVATTAFVAQQQQIMAQQQPHQPYPAAAAPVHHQQPQQQQQQGQQQQQQQQQQPRGRVALEGPYGLLALPGLIQHSLNLENPESAAFLYLTRGFDLTSLGINVAQQRPLYPTLASLALERPEVPVAAEYRIPDCYRQAKPRQPTLKLLQKYTDETLLYIFYSMPRDLLQVAAARVLLERGWWFHKVRQQWMRRRTAGGYDFFNQNKWKMETEENYQPNLAEVEKDLSDPARAGLSAVVSGGGGGAAPSTAAASAVETAATTTATTTASTSAAATGATGP